ncbi:metal-sulfur cluster biosynthetic enzyme [ANME-1 cluster archaeon AG-394-G21]|nr:metal-sulfur cluster biosynthetic enzyme [ANME-1 cluster archaeon AG-394-G21]NAT10961.1 metal-sulfur cluster biosynthetic enzyme [ANME-1 cluster archaeon AG-394-G06]
MAKEKSEEDIRQVVAGIKHPAIDRTLVDLGVVKEITVKGNKVLVTMALPFPGIPTQVRDYLVNSVVEQIKKMDVEVEVDLTIMNQEERQAFLDMEQESWKGGT